MQFNDLLSKSNIDPADVIVFRHRPKEPKLRKVLSWLVDEDHALFNAYQQTQGPVVENAMLRAKHVASFIGHEPGKAFFVGLYANTGHRALSFDQYWKVRENALLRERYGLVGMTNRRAKTLWFELELTKFCAAWKGKLVVSWPGKELSWWRWADRNEFAITSILEDSLLDRRMPDWNQLVLTWSELAVLPRRWREELSRWRGVYHILDESDGRSYVGSAYGAENLYGRWLTYAKSGHGGNKKLKGRNPKHFRFSVLQVLPHDMDEADVRFIESTWKDRLHTREFGLNDN